MTLMERRRALMAAKKRGGLPSEYQQVEWIGFNGNCWLELGAMSNQNPGFDADFLIESRHNIYGPHLIGSADNLLTFVPRGTHNGLIALNGTSNEVLPNFATNQRYAVSARNGVAEMNGIQYQLSAGAVTSSSAMFVSAYAANKTNLDFHLFGKIYGSLKIYDGNAEVFKLVPCYRKADSVIGMYDLVSKTFFTNAGIGTFTKGADV